MGTTNYDIVDASGGFKVNDVTVINSAGEVVADVTGELALADGEAIEDDANNSLIEAGVTASAVNHIKVTNAATGNDPKIEATGTDANIDLEIAGKGTGAVNFTSPALYLQGVQSGAQQRTPNNDDGPNSIINTGVTAVDVQAVTNDANDWIVLPAVSSVQVGHTITIACNAGTNFELRTPASSNEKINNVDADGTQEYLCTDTDTVRISKLSDTDGWVAQSITNLGAVRTAVVPD